MQAPGQAPAGSQPQQAPPSSAPAQSQLITTAQIQQVSTMFATPQCIGECWRGHTVQGTSHTVSAWCSNCWRTRPRSGQLRRTPRPAAWTLLRSAPLHAGSGRQVLMFVICRSPLWPPDTPCCLLQVPVQAAGESYVSRVRRGRAAAARTSLSCRHRPITPHALRAWSLNVHARAPP